eukprot:jgi/Chlat1/5992/Chrsp4S06193
MLMPAPVVYGTTRPRSIIMASPKGQSPASQHRDDVDRAQERTLAAGGGTGSLADIRVAEQHESVLRSALPGDPNPTSTAPAADAGNVKSQGVKVAAEEREHGSKVATAVFNETAELAGAQELQSEVGASTTDQQLPQKSSHDAPPSEASSPSKPPRKKHKPSPKAARLSFEDELQADEKESYSLAESTARRFQKERSGGVSASRPTPYSEASHLQPSTSEPSRSLLSDKTNSSQTLGPAKSERPYMEDRHAIVPGFTFAPRGGMAAAQDGLQRSYCAVFDGHNGAKAAEYASRRLHIILGADRSLPFGGSIGPQRFQEEASVSTAMMRAFEQVDQEILAMTKEQGTRDGCTALVALLLGQALYIANAGDSRAVLCNSDGSVERLTTDHKPNLDAERKRVESVGGHLEFHGCWRVASGDMPMRLAVSRSLGDLDFKVPLPVVSAKPDVHTLRLRPPHMCVILGTDGLWDAVSDAAAGQIVLSSLQASASKADGDAKAAADALVASALKLGTLDNVTALVMLFQWD